MANIDGQADCEICHQIVHERELEFERTFSRSNYDSDLSCHEMFHRHRRFSLDHLSGFFSSASEWFYLIENKHLCAFCSHLRLENLRSLFYSALGVVAISIYLDDFPTLKQKQQCIFCQLVAKIIDRHNKFPGREMVTRVKFCVRGDPLEVVIRDNENNFICSLKIEADSDYECSLKVEADSDYESPPPRDTHPVLRSQPIVWSKVNNWLKKSKVSEVLKQQPPGFRVIDVEKGCVVPAPPLCEYVTLSYVWGEAPGQFQAMSSNIGLLECHGSLAKPEVPRTIKDAMYVCSRLNKRYLWVDRFCIVQDHPPSRGVQIDAMNSIYSHSFVTLVAAEGHDADFGLCGISKDRMYGIFFQNTRVREIHDSTSSGNPNWKWMSRGWTLQESVLSTRLLVFTEKSLYFKHSNDINFQSDLNSDLRLQDYIDVTWPNSKDSLGWYSRNLNDYTKRTLGNPQDILRAFTGIMSSLFGQRHLFGLPFAHFGEALLWYPTGHADLRKPEGESRFPTWSWASNTSPIEHQNCLLTIASCAAAVSTGASERWEWSVISIAGLPTNNFSNLKSGYYSMALKLAREMALIDEELVFDWEKNNFDRDIGWTEAEPLRKFSLDDQCDSPPSWDHISIHTQKVRLLLDPRIHQISPSRIMIILRSSKCPVGFLFLDNIESEDSILPRLQDGEEIFRDNLALSINFFSKKQHVDFHEFYSTAEVFGSQGQSESARYEIIQGNGEAPTFLPPELVSVCSKHNDIFTLNVMAVEKSNSGIFRRIGLGQIFLEKWGGLDPEVGAFMIE